MLCDLSEDAIAEDFCNSAKINDTQGLLYIPARDQWFARATDSDGQSYWNPAGEPFYVRQLIREHLRQIASQYDRSPSIRMRLGSLQTILAVEEFVRWELASDESALEPGELALREQQSISEAKEANKQSPRPPQPMWQWAALSVQAQPTPGPKPAEPTYPAPVPQSSLSAERETTAHTFAERVMARAIVEKNPSRW
jgi:hypothetical protein